MKKKESLRLSLLSQNDEVDSRVPACCREAIKEARRNPRSIGGLFARGMSNDVIALGLDMTPDEVLAIRKSSVSDIL